METDRGGIPLAVTESNEELQQGYLGCNNHPRFTCGGMAAFVKLHR